MSTNVALALVPSVQAEQPAPLTVAQKIQMKLEALMQQRTQSLRKEVETYLGTQQKAQESLVELRERKAGYTSQIAAGAAYVEALRANADEDQDLIDMCDEAEAELGELRTTDACLTATIAELEAHIALTERTIEAKQGEIVQTEQKLRAALQPKPVEQPEPERFLEPAALPTAGVKLAPVADVKAGLAIALANKSSAERAQKPAEPQWPGVLSPKELSRRLDVVTTMLTNGVGSRDARLTSEEIAQVASYAFYAAMYAARKGVVTPKDAMRLERLFEGHEVPECFKPMVLRDCGEKVEGTERKLYICSAPEGIPCCKREKSADLRYMVHGTTILLVCWQFGKISKAVNEQVLGDQAKFLLSTQFAADAERFVLQNKPFMPKKEVKKVTAPKEPISPADKEKKEAARRARQLAVSQQGPKGNKNSGGGNQGHGKGGKKGGKKG